MASMPFEASGLRSDTYVKFPPIGPTTGDSCCPGPKFDDCGCSDRVVPSTYDVCIVGAGPHSLAVLSALMAKQVGSNGQNPRVCVIDPAGVWMHEWHSDFSTLRIDYLRSPAWAHPDACCQEAMVDFARREGRMSELKDVDFQGTSLDGMSKTAAGYYKNPTSELFKNFCDSLVSTLPHYFLRGSVIDIIKTSPNYEVIIKSHAEAQSKISATHIVLALGARGCANVPAQFTSLVANREGRVVHSSDVRRLAFMASKFCTDDTVLVIGGGLSAAQAALLAVDRGVRRTVLCSRRPLVTRHYDLPIEWMDDRMGRAQERNRDRVACFFSLPPSDRIKALKCIRGGGSVPPDYMEALASHVRKRRLEITVDSVCSAEATDDSITVHFSSGSTITVSCVIIGTGFAIDSTKIPLFKTVAEHFELPVQEGFPVLTDDLAWRENENITVVGSLAAGALGPCAFNLVGASLAQ